MTTKKKTILMIIVAVLIPLLVGGLSAILTSDQMNVYETLKRPPLAPPGWLFPIAWTILYVLMGLASYFVFSANVASNEKRSALIFYFVQLVMNFFWSIFFFNYSLYWLSLIWLLVMWILIIICVKRFYKIRKIAGITMIPLLAWTTFAAYLNLMYCIYSCSLK